MSQAQNVVQIANSAIQYANYQAKKTLRDQAVIELRAANPQLIAGQDCVTAAKNIRKELKAAFPNIKFSVNTQKYAGGNSINVRYMDGVNAEAVEAITSKYEMGSFNGMEDIYEYADNVWGEAFGDTKYLFVNRDFSDEAMQKGIDAIEAEYGNLNKPSVGDFRNGFARNVSPLQDGGWSDAHNWQSLVYRKMVKMDF